MKQQNIIKELIKKKNFKKNELKKKILKSIFQNRNSFNKIRLVALLKINKNKKKSSISLQKNLCLFSGKYKSIWRFANCSRHFLKKLNLNGSTTNLKKYSW